jgi:hypothetical protein
MVLREAPAADGSPRLKLRSDEGDQAGRKDSRGTKPELTQARLELADPLVELTDPLVQSCHVGPELGPPSPHLRPELSALSATHSTTLSTLSAELLEDAVKGRVDDGHPVVVPRST